MLLSTARQGKWPNNSSPIVIVFVCKQLRREALPVVLREVTFRLEALCLRPHELANRLYWPATNLIEKLTINWQLEKWFLGLWSQDAFQNLKELRVEWPTQSIDGIALPPAASRDYPFLLSLLKHNALLVKPVPVRPDDAHRRSTERVASLFTIRSASVELVHTFHIRGFGRVVIAGRGGQTQAIVETGRKIERVQLPTEVDMKFWLLARGRSKLGGECRDMSLRVINDKIRRGGWADNMDALFCSGIPWVTRKIAEFDAFDDGL